MALKIRNVDKTADTVIQTTAVPFFVRSLYVD